MLQVLLWLAEATAWQLWVEEASPTPLTSCQPPILWDSSSQTGLVVCLGRRGYLRITTVSESSADLAPCPELLICLFMALHPGAVSLGPITH